MALTANREVDHYVDQELRSLPVDAGVTIHKGALVGLVGTGHARPLVAGDLFVGIAYEQIDNGTGAAGDTAVRVYTLGDFGHTLAGAAVSNIGAAVYASAEDTLTLTATSNSFVGHVVDVPASGEIILRLDTFKSAP